MKCESKEKKHAAEGSISYCVDQDRAINNKTKIILLLLEQDKQFKGFLHRSKKVVLNCDQQAGHTCVNH